MKSRWILTEISSVSVNILLLSTKIDMNNHFYYQVKRKPLKVDLTSPLLCLENMKAPTKHAQNYITQSSNMANPVNLWEDPCHNLAFKVCLQNNFTILLKVSIFTWNENSKSSWHRINLKLYTHSVHRTELKTGQSIFFCTKTMTFHY